LPNITKSQGQESASNLECYKSHKLTKCMSGGVAGFEAYNDKLHMHTVA